MKVKRVNPKSSHCKEKILFSFIVNIILNILNIIFKFKKLF